MRREKLTRRRVAWAKGGLRGFKVETFNRMLEEQDWRCAICGKRRPVEKLFLDHDHDTGKARGILCGGCNAGIGQLRDSWTLARRAATYLRKHGAVDKPTLEPLETQAQTRPSTTETKAPSVLSEQTKKLEKSTLKLQEKVNDIIAAHERGAAAERETQNLRDDLGRRAWTFYR